MPRPRKKKKQATPRRQVPKGFSSRSGTEPPREHRWKPGESGNPAGRPSAGAALREWVNLYAQQELTEAELRKIAQNEKLPWMQRAAAERILRTLEHGDLADMAPALDGYMSLSDLRKSGVNTEVVKKFKVKRRVLVNGEEIVERELELHDRGGEEFDRIVNQTDGTPTQRIDMNAHHVAEPDPIILVHTAPPAKE